MTNDSQNYVWSKNGMHLYIVFGGEGNSGLFKCIAENSVGRDEFLFIVNVLAPPQLIANIDRSSETLHASEGGSIELKCPIDGNPIPTIIWAEVDGNRKTDSAKNLMEITNSTLVRFEKSNI